MNFGELGMIDLGLMSIIDWIRYGVTKANQAELFYGHGTDNVFDEIRWLVLGSLSLPWDIDAAYLQSNLTQDEKKYLFDQLDKRIEKRIPVPYLINQAQFCGLSFYVDSRVLIPRSPMAELIENAFSPWISDEPVTRILDLCTGSACIAIACCYAFPDALVDAVDISEDALEVAKINQKKHQVEQQLQLIKSDLFTGIMPEQQYDVIISNPPYVSREEMLTLPDEYRHEPVLALEAPNNGLALVHQILKQAAMYLKPNGILIIEVGNSADALIDAYPEMPFVWLDFEHGGDGVFLLTRESLL